MFNAPLFDDWHDSATKHEYFRVNKQANKQFAISMIFFAFFAVSAISFAPLLHFYGQPHTMYSGVMMTLSVAGFLYWYICKTMPLAQRRMDLYSKALAVEVGSMHKLIDDVVLYGEDAVPSVKH